MAKLQLRGEYLKGILESFDTMEKGVNDPRAALLARRAKIIPAEIVMAHLAASITWLSKRHSFFLTEQLVNEIMHGLRNAKNIADADLQQRINKMLEQKANDDDNG